MRVKPSVLVDWVHIFVLVGFAVAQPLYDILGQYPEFLLSHKASPVLIIVVVFALSFGLPLCLITFELLAWLVGGPVRRSVHWIFIFFLAMLAGIPIVKQTVVGPDIFIIGTSFLLALLFVVFYARSKPIRLFLNLLTPAVVIFPLWFLLFTPIKGLVLPQDIGVQTVGEIKNPVPVVVVVLDEFTVTALLDKAGKVDEVRFPNFADLASESWWFPNAIAAAQTTEAALPAILSGRHPPTLFSIPPPTADNYPQTLFTMLGDHYQFNVIESMTALCPESLCGREREALGLRWPIVFSDMVVIYLHLLSTPVLSQHLPSLGVQWGGFGKKLIFQPELNGQQGVSPPKGAIHFSLERDLTLDQSVIVQMRGFK